MLLGSVARVAAIPPAIRLNRRRDPSWLYRKPGVWLILAPWLLEGAGSSLAAWNGVIGGLVLILLALPRGPIKDSYAGWDRYIA